MKVIEMPDASKAEILKIERLRDTGDFAEALSECQTTIRLAPGNPDYHEHLAVALFDLGREDEALSHAADISDPAVQAAYRNRLGDLLHDRGRRSGLPMPWEHDLGYRIRWWDDALEQYQAAVRLAPGDPGYHEDLAVALFDLGREDEALSHAADISDPAVQAAYRNRLGDLLRDRGQLDDALGQYQATVRLAPDNTLFQDHLSTVQFLKMESEIPREFNWGEMLGGTTTALMLLTVLYLALERFTGARWPPVGQQIALTILLVGFAGIALWFSWYAISSHGEIQEWARTSNDDDDFVSKAIAEGPADAIKDTAVNAFGRFLLSLEFGWTAIPLLNVTFAALLVLTVCNLWSSGSALQVEPASVSGSSSAYAMAVFEHVAYYVFWGGALIAALAAALAALLSRRKDVLGLFGGAVISTAALVIYIVFEGVWP